MKGLAWRPKSLGALVSKLEIGVIASRKRDYNYSNSIQKASLLQIPLKAAKDFSEALHEHLLAKP
jgi:hypothetical protein